MRVKNEKTIETIKNTIDMSLNADGRSPSLAEIAEKTGVSVATVSRYVRILIERGQIVRKGKFCALTSSNVADVEKVRMLPVVGCVACGAPIYAEQNISGYVALSGNLTGTGEFFCLRAQGDSMINAGIEDGDLVLVRRQSTADEGQIVVALTDGEDATLKRYFVDKKNARIRLHPENDQMSDMFFDDVSVQGVAVKVLKDLK